jgi:hypothetical protein
MKTSWNDTFVKTFDTKQWSKDNKRCPNKKMQSKNAQIKKMGERELKKEFENEKWSITDK